MNVIKWFKFGIQFNEFVFYILRNNLKWIRKFYVYLKKYLAYISFKSV